MQAFLQVLLAVLAAWVTWWLVRRLLRPRSPAEPADDPLSKVPAPARRGPKGLAGAVALEEPGDNDSADSFPPRSL